MSGDSAAILSAIAGCIASRIGGVEIEPVARLGEAELVEEDLGHRVEPVLPRVQDDLFDACIAECADSGAVGDDGGTREAYDGTRGVPMPASRSAADSGAALMNWRARFPTTVPVTSNDLHAEPKPTSACARGLGSRSSRLVRERFTYFGGRGCPVIASGVVAELLELL